MSEFHKGQKVKNVRTGDTGTITEIDTRVWTGRHYATRAIVKLTNGKTLKWALSSLTVVEEVAPRALVRLKAICKALYARETDVRKKFEADLKAYCTLDSSTDQKGILNTIDKFATGIALNSSKMFNEQSYNYFTGMVFMLEILTSRNYSFYCSHIDELHGFNEWSNIAKFQSELNRLYLGWLKD